MKFKNFEIYNMANVLLGAFADEEGSQTLPIKLSYTIKKNTAKFKTVAEEIEKSRVELIKKYGEPTEDGQGYMVKPENEEAANKEFSELMDLEEEIDVHMIDINSLSDTVQITNAQMDAIMFMLKDGEEE